MLFKKDLIFYRVMFFSAMPVKTVVDEMS